MPDILEDAWIRFREKASVADFPKIQPETKSLIIDVTYSGGGKREIMESVASALRIQDDSREYLNWDSLEESVRDLSWLDADNITIYFHNSKAAWCAAYREMGVLTEIISGSIIKHRNEGKRFRWIFLE
jgi:hypothetical protein